MEAPEAVNQLLKKKYDLHKSPEVEKAAERTNQQNRLHNTTVSQADEKVPKVPQEPLARIQNYLDRLSNIVNPPQLEGNPNFDRRERNLEMIKKGLYDKFIIRPDEISDNYWENQKRIIRERGQGADLERVDFEELKKQNTEAIIADQKSSLDKWVDYLSSPDAPYPDALKYFTVRSVLYMGEYDKEKKIYPQRSKGTTKPFPDLNREALAYVLNAVEKKYAGQQADQASNSPEFEKLLQGENFAKLYAWAIEKVTPESAENLINTKGQWIKYDQSSDHMPLVHSLQGHGTGWCTAGESVAETQLKGGDFYVYYSFDNDGEPNIPRVAIRMDGNNIGEVRGIAKEQNLDPYIDDIVEKKLKEFPDGELHKKKVNDMKLLTSLDNKTRLDQSLTPQDLVFLYEINTPIDGFGYQKDPRIAELRSQRNADEDMPVVFGCDKIQIAHSVGEINKNTKAFVGALAPGIFDVIQKYNIEHVYTSFPEGKIRRESIEIGGKTAKQLEQELGEANINISEYAEDMLHSKDFTTLPNPETLDTVRLKVADLGLSGNPTTDQVYARAKELGMELIPAEAGVRYRLKNRTQQLYDYLYMGMKQIADRHGNPDVFRLDRDGDGLWLSYDWTDTSGRWGPKNEFVFALRPPAAPELSSGGQGKSEPKKLGLLDRLLKR